MDKVKAGVILPFAECVFTTGDTFFNKRDSLYITWYGYYFKSDKTPYLSGCEYKEYIEQIKNTEPIPLLAILYGCELTFPE